jgi:Ni,Fe-hydrogenase III large subunit
MVLDIFEHSTGNRVLHGINVVGGVLRDIGPGMAAEIGRFCDAIEKKCHELEGMITGSYTIKQRLQGVGVMSEQLAHELCVVGPVARGSNIAYDIRSIAPYLLYDEIGFRPIVEKDGDCWSRSIIRVRELFQSIDLIRSCLPLLADAPQEIFAKPGALPDGENFARVEAPRGELFYYVRARKSKDLDRVKVRTSTYANGVGFEPLIRGSHLADIGLITITYDPCIGCFDR